MNYKLSVVVLGFACLIGFTYGHPFDPTESLARPFKDWSDKLHSKLFESKSTDGSGQSWKESTDKFHDGLQNKMNALGTGEDRKTAIPFQGLSDKLHSRVLEEGNKLEAKLNDGSFPMTDKVGEFLFSHYDM